ncbi:Sucrose-phosphate synthase 1 [Hordeum vulgare]|uniref:Sucrose-phosphate synthase n=2 Tax=Hordeum vulgare subsp. vulgare TaxID=112509 RepID=A0A8I6YJP6_HORVV|nr:probable sucrose-phosphate synthase 3 [Hordeum vulgare subsp. vulgare]KAE8792207.1 Sucrose-phosphate synthase 1 [Hordeum vulgare]
MYGNDNWINSYLDAILDAGKGAGSGSGGGGGGDRPSLLLRERGHFSPARYFVEEVITGYDETDLYKTWSRANAMRSPQERNTRLENMTWRIWNLARKKKEVEDAKRLKRRLETEKPRTDATAEMSEDLFEGEKGEDAGDASVAYGDSSAGNTPRIGAVDKLYIVLISLHGLVRGENLELGRDSDTSGQVKYVVELAKALSSCPGVYRVDLLTRQILAPNYDRGYGEPSETLVPTSSKNLKQERGENSGAYITRIPFGPKDKYLAKEHLWPYVQEFVDGALSHIVHMSKIIGEEIGCGHPMWPAVIHGHYASAGVAAALISGALNVHMVFTGHFLGKDKLEGLLKQGRQTREEINMTYKIMRRIEAEELSLDASEIVIASTRQEIEEQWNLYDGFEVMLARKLRARVKRGANCYGRYMPRMVIIPPGVEFGHMIHEFDMDGEEDSPSPASEDPPIWSEIMRFFTNPRKPLILAVARPYPEKNITTLVKAFGECRPLRELANLTLIMGNREAISKMSNMSAAVLTSVLTLIDEYDLYGQVAYPKHHKHSEVLDIYRLAARTKGAFVNVAYFEQFGVTLIEAAMHGLPVIATKNGAPVEIHQVLDNGLLVDPHDQHAIADALYKLLSDKQLWSRCRENGLKNIHRFSWPEHCKNYLSRILTLSPRYPAFPSNEDQIKAPIKGRKCIIVIAVDSASKKDLVCIIKNSIEATHKETLSGSTGFVLSTSLTMSEIHSLLISAGMAPTDFDAFICNSGSDLFYPLRAGDSPSTSRVTFALDRNYQSHIEYRWGGEGLRKYLVKWASSIVERRGRTEKQVIFEDAEHSSTSCLAFRVVNPNYLPPLKELQKLMRIQSLRCHALYNHSATRLSVIPIHASRSQALRYLSVRWGIELRNVVILVGESGDSDYEELFGGLHKTIVLKGEFNTPANRIHTVRRYPLQDVIALDCSNIIGVEGCSTDDLTPTLKTLGIPTK